MTDSLRTRIAAVMVKAMSEYGYCEELGSKTVVDAEIDFNTVADAVIRELCIHREDMNEWDVLANGFRGHRYVTHWEENDPAPVTKIRPAEKLGLSGDGE